MDSSVATRPSRDEQLRLSGGGDVSFRHYGLDGGKPVLALHGTPGSRLKFVGADAFASAHGIHLIAPDRWAYGGSSAPAKPTLAAFAAEMVELMQRLGHRRFAVVGVSGGGPFATAVASVAPEHVTALGLVSPVGLVAAAARAGEVDLFHRFCFQALSGAPRAVNATFNLYARAIRANARLACGLTTLRAPKSDKAVMCDAAASAALLASFQEGLRLSGRGPAIDLALFRDIASLDLARANMPAQVWIGLDDRNVPVGAARRLAAALPNATLTELPDTGHLWIARNMDVVLRWTTRT